MMSRTARESTTKESAEHLWKLWADACTRSRAPPKLGLLTYTMIHGIISERRSAQRGDDLDFS